MYYVLNANHIPGKWAGGEDGVKTKIIKQVRHDISLLCHIFNLSFQQGIFPDILKLTKVIPIYEKEDSHYIFKLQASR